MLIYNKNKINTSPLKKQPIIYKDEKELIDWLNYDLSTQQSDKTIFSIESFYESNKIIANIGNDKNIIKIDFEFNFQVIKNKFNKIEDYKLNFKNIIFNKKVFFENIHLYNEVFFNNAEFKSEISFSNIFSNKNLYFNNSIFHNELNFIKSEFYGDVYFNETIIKKNINIKKSLIASNMLLNNIKINNNIIFEEIIFKDNNSYLSIKNENSKKNQINNFYFTNVLIDGIIDLQNIEVNEANFKGSVINGGLINPVNFKVHKFANRESALFLKQQAYARNNAIDALEYKAKEIDKHKEDLIKDWQKNKDFKTFGDIVSIGLSSLYSDNGQNWMRAFICTILFPTVFFTLSYTNFKVGLYFYILLITYAINILFFKDILEYIINSILVYLIACILLPLIYIEITSFDESYIKELFMFLIPTNFEQIKESIYIYNDNTLFRGFNYFIGKIAFWYGSVQTVTAFRKFAKGA
ncbi:pentapeptide repeat-containing protein [Brachyspira pilosicoli]|uniref:pentapeptide repeat-containing protein n=1 Tax=Brachyspira pilosicoli TaxID=52584 RepID=UPI0018DF450D|nr:pentapeptide repeat-containing protein [Brachyspira pilosicoli]